MFFLFIERDVLAQIDHLAVDAGADIAGPSHLQQFFPIFPLPPTHDRGQDLELHAFRQRGNRIDHLLDGLRRDFLSTLKTVGTPDAGKEETEIVVNLRDGADGGSGVMAGALLLDGDGRRQAFDGIDIRLPHLFEELPGIGGERLDVPPLPFRIDGVECQRRLAGPAQAGDHHELVARNFDVDVLEVMLPRALDDDGVAHRGGIIACGLGRLDKPGEAVLPRSDGPRGYTTCSEGK